MTIDQTNSDPQPLAERINELEGAVAQTLMRAAESWLGMQGMAQPAAVASLATALHDAYEVRVELVIGPHRHMRILTVDAEGNDNTLIRRLDLQMQPAAH